MPSTNSHTEGLFAELLAGAKAIEERPQIIAERDQAVAERNHHAQQMDEYRQRFDQMQATIESLQSALSAKEAELSAATKSSHDVASKLEVVLSAVKSVVGEIGAAVSLVEPPAPQPEPQPIPTTGSEGIGAAEGGSKASTGEGTTGSEANQIGMGHAGEMLGAEDRQLPPTLPSSGTGDGSQSIGSTQTEGQSAADPTQPNGTLAPSTTSSTQSSRTAETSSGSEPSAQEATRSSGIAPFQSAASTGEASNSVHSTSNTPPAPGPTVDPSATASQPKPFGNGTRWFDKPDSISWYDWEMMGGEPRPMQ